MDERLLAVVFTDLVRSTEAFTRLGPVEAHRVRTEHFRHLSTSVHTHGGEVVKTTGDGAMAIFPLATSALDCAVVMQAQFSEAARQPLAGLRVGVSVGQATVEDGDYHGEAVTTAARLCQAAHPATILCARAVRLVIGAGTGHVLRPVDPLALRGLGEQVEADELLWTRPATAPVRVVIEPIWNGLDAAVAQLERTGPHPNIEGDAGKLMGPWIAKLQAYGSC